MAMCTVCTFAFAALIVLYSEAMENWTHTDGRRADAVVAAARAVARSALLAVCLIVFALGCWPSAYTQAFAAEMQTRPLLVIVAGFDGGDTGNAFPYDAAYDWSAAAFGRDESLSTFYEDMSGGAFTFAPAAETCAYDIDGVSNTADQVNDGVVHVTLNQAFKAWGTINEDEGVARDFAHTVFEAFEAAGTYVDFSAYDTNGDTVIDPDELVVVILVPGYDASSMGDPANADIPQLWPHAGTISSEGPISSGDAIMHLRSYIALTEYTWDATAESDPVRQEPLGILYHELGHYLGLPDLYAINADAESQAWGAYKVGPLSLMDSGGWSQVLDDQGFWRNEPSALDAWSRYMLGWSMPFIVTESNDYVVSSQWSQRGYESLLIPTSDPDQYYLIENRQPEGHDAGFAAAFEDGNSRGGLLIWHVDKSIYRVYGEQNAINDTDHAPGLMPLFFETSNSDGNYTLTWENTSPYQSMPFFDASRLTTLVGTNTIELPLYSADDGAPSERVGSGITVSVLDDSARDMMIHVELPSAQCAESERSYDLPDAGDFLHTTNDPLGVLASTALIRETSANIALLDAASLKAGVPSGEVSYAAAFDALPQDAPIVMFDAKGQQVVDVIETSLEALWQARQSEGWDGTAQAADESGVSSSVLEEALCVSGIACTIDWNAEPHKRLKKVLVNGEKIDLDASYRVASTEKVATRFGFANTWSRNTLVVFGSPADALRSFMQSTSWEVLVGDACESIRYVEPVKPQDDDGQVPGLQPGSPSEAKSQTQGVEQGSTSEPTLPFGLDAQQGIIVSILMFLYSISPYALIVVPVSLVLAGFIFTFLRRSR